MVYSYWKFDAESNETGLIDLGQIEKKLLKKNRSKFAKIRRNRPRAIKVH
jgi:hypothetical protein